MKFDTILIGGGLSALTCGIKLAKAGRKCAVIAAGESALSFNSGSFGLLSRLPDGTPVDNPLEGAAKLPETHPYSKVDVRKYAADVIPFFAKCGIGLTGGESNLWRFTSSGRMKRCWLTMEDTTGFATPDDRIGTKALIVTITGFQDFFPGFIAEELEKRGLACRCETVDTASLRALRESATEMRATNIALAMEKEPVRKAFIKAVSALRRDEDILILPQVFGAEDTAVLKEVRKGVGMPVTFVSTLMPSVPGIRTQKLLKKEFLAAGGTLMMGDSVTGGKFDGDRLVSVTTSNLGEYPLEADTFVLASGSFHGKGMASDFTHVFEPVFGLEVDAAEARTDWYSDDFFGKQPYRTFGVKTDGSLRVSRGGRTVSNVYAAGAVLSGAEPLYEGSGAGIAVITALAVADKIMEG